MTKVQSPKYSDILDTLAQLFPNGEIRGSRIAANPEGFRLVPGRARPKIIVPAGSPLAAADAVNRPAAGDSALRQLGRRALASLLRSPFGWTVMRSGIRVSGESDSIVRYLSDLHGEPVRISMTIGAPRANRKPVLNVHTLDGTEVGFAKVGLTELTNTLVRHEHNVLSLLARKKETPFQTPVPLHTGRWQGHEVLLMTALRTQRSSKIPHGPWGAAAAIAVGDGLSEHRLSTSRWLVRLSERCAEVNCQQRDALLRLFESFSAVYGNYVLPFGSWHGDFGPWNLNVRDGIPMIWDWERYQTDVPLGIDAVHYSAHKTLRQTNDMTRARQVLTDNAYDALNNTLSLTGWSTAEPRRTFILEAIISGYLLMIATRFAVDGVATGNRPVQELGDWYQRVLADRLNTAGLDAGRAGRLGCNTGVGPPP
ncbi:hypothetical protein [Arthrobacter castelli]|uniref:hypothetical protein n=1 Tax=Arthrobacter castelli TaxID=271431 RepID=UPI0004264DF8|nr:hypothetical protein [Arthrobacter castelli]